MASDLGTGGSGRNVDLNIVPFIDLMSCLTAFLLVTAAWVGTAQLDIHPQALAHDPTCPDGTCDDPKLSVLIEPDSIFIGISRLGELERIARNHTDDDWGRLRASLDRQKASVYFATSSDIEVAALGTVAQPIQYQALVSAMDVARAAGFPQVALTEPNALSARPSF